MDLVVKWDKMGPEFTYEVWYAKSPGGPWIRHHDFRLTDDVIAWLRDAAVTGSAPYPSDAQNIYIIDGLDASTNYSVKVTCSDKYHQWWYSYSAYDGIDGGYGSPFTRPTPTGDNTVGFQFNLVLPDGFGYGPFGLDPPFGG